LDERGRSLTTDRRLAKRTSTKADLFLDWLMRGRLVAEMDEAGYGEMVMAATAVLFPSSLSEMAPSASAFAMM